MKLNLSLVQCLPDIFYMQTGRDAFKQKHSSLGTCFTDVLSSSSSPAVVSSLKKLGEGVVNPKSEKEKSSLVVPKRKGSIVKSFKFKNGEFGVEPKEAVVSNPSKRGRGVVGPLGLKKMESVVWGVGLGLKMNESVVKSKRSIFWVTSFPKIGNAVVNPFGRKISSRLRSEFTIELVETIR